MQTVQLKEYLYKIADNVTTTTTIEDIYEQLQMLLDVEESEWQIENNLVISHKNAKEQAREWLA